MRIQTISGAGHEGTYGSGHKHLISSHCCNKSCYLRVLIVLAFTLPSLSARLSLKSLKQKLLMCEYMLSTRSTFIYDKC